MPLIGVPLPVAGAIDPLEKIVAERMRQLIKWGDQEHSDLRWSVILGEEFGESMKELCELEAARDRIMQANPGSPEIVDLRKKIYEIEQKLETELVQTAAVIVSWLEGRTRRRRKSEENDGS